MRLQDYDDPRSFGMRLRARRLRPFLDMIQAVHRRNGAVRILDIGGRRNYWGAAPEGFLAAHGCRIRLSNSEDAERGAADAIFSEVREDGCDLSYEDGAFDLVHSNSVVEHVGDWARMTAFAREVRRIGDGYFVQTPAYWFPWEPHYGFPFFAQLPRPVQRGLLMRRRMGFFAQAGSLDEAEAVLDGTRLLDGAQMRALFPDAQMRPERIAGLTKSLIAMRPPAFAGTYGKRA